MSILGIDAGLGAPGMAAVDQNYNLIHAECFVPEQVLIQELINQGKAKNKSDANQQLNKMTQTGYDLKRIALISNRIADLVLKYRPKVVVVEFPTGGAKSAAAIKGMAFSTGVTASTIFTVQKLAPDYKFELFPITPMQNKKGGTNQTKWHGDDDKWSVLWAVDSVWPGTPWPTKKSKKCAGEYDETSCWAMADACSCILTYMRLKNIPTDGLSFKSS